MQAFVALDWRNNFHSDEAVVGLMARHILRGRIPVYYYGENYLGSLDAILVAGAMKLMGHSPLVIRLPSVVMYGVWLALHGILINRLWGGQVALLSLLVLAFPGGLLPSTYQPNVCYGPMAILGTVLFLFALPRGPGGRRVHLLRWLGAGAAIGLGMWIHPMSLLYAGTVLIILLLRSPEWQAMHLALGKKVSRNGRLLVCGMKLLVVLGMMVLLVVIFFTGACQPERFFAAARAKAVATVILVLLLEIGGVLAISRRRGPLVISAGALVVGLVLGNSPQWYAWVFLGIRPSMNISPSCPTVALGRLRVLATELLPEMWGTPVLHQFEQMPTLFALVWTVVLGLAVSAILNFTWISWRGIRCLITLSPLTQQDTGSAVYALLFAGPIVSTVLASNIFNEPIARFLVVTWQASAVVLAVFMLRLFRWSRILGTAAIGMWLLLAGVGGVLRWHSHWQTGSRYDPENVAALETFLARHGVKGGYANYWLADAANFATAERLTFVPYNGQRRYQPYVEKVRRWPVHAYLFCPGDIPDTASTIDDVIREMGIDRRSGPAFRTDQFQTGGKVVRERQRVGEWDVWLLARDSQIVGHVWAAHMASQCGTVVVAPNPRDGRPMPVRQALAGDRGYLMFGPGVTLPAGTYVAEFTLEKVGDFVDIGAQAALLDVTAGQHVVASAVTTAEHTATAGAFAQSVTFQHNGAGSLVFRVAVSGGVSIRAYWVTVRKAAPSSSKVVPVDNSIPPEGETP